MPVKETINYYDILGVSTDASLEEIRKRYNKLIIKYHPDKIKNKEDEGIFEIVQRAYDILGDDKKRQEYDFYLNNIKNVSLNDHFSLKKDFEEYAEKYYTNTDKDKSKNEFENKFKLLDEKHGIHRDDNIKLDTEEITSRLDNLILEREQDEIEFSQNKVFNEFDISKFNSAFDLYKSGESSQITEYKDVKAFNFNNFMNLDNENLYCEDNYEGNDKYSNINIFKPTINLSKDKVKNLKPSNYTHNHNKIDKEFNDDIERRIKERELETHNLNNITFEEFNNEDNNFLFSHQVGITQNILDWTEEMNDDTLQTCRKLIELEKNN